ncbi:MAG TPA: hypothetical protein VGO52_13370 [Hyphomonadaceae bacterium]|jgi:hypothetical protein|nr:hypothetical protein [Hyphomonadaceae bacterium]
MPTFKAIATIAVICGLALPSAAFAQVEAEAQDAATPETAEPAITSLGLLTATEPFADQDKLLEELLTPGRCPLRYKAQYMQPCAVIAYMPVHDDEAAAPIDVVFRPIFGVEPAGKDRYKVWTVKRSEFRDVPLDVAFMNLETASATGKAIIKYTPFRVIGNKENEERCERKEACLSSSNRRTDLFEQYRFVLKPDQADRFW